MANAISFFVISIFIYLWVKWHDILNVKQIWWIGFTIGIMALVRFQNLIFDVFFLPQIKKSIEEWKGSNNFLSFLKLNREPILMEYLLMLSLRF